MKYHIKNEEWEVIFKKLQNIKGIDVQDQEHTRKFIEAVWYIVRSGCQWRLLPSVYGHLRGVHMRFKSWSNKGVWDWLFNLTLDRPDMEFVMIDTTGQRNDITQAQSLITNITNSIVIADKGYEANSLITVIEEQKSTAVMPAQKNRKTRREYDSHIYKEGHLIECFFGKIKNFRRIFWRFDKTAVTFMGFLNFVGTLIWLR
jgi:transposase